MAKYPNFRIYIILCLPAAGFRYIINIWGELMRISIGETLAGLRKAKKFMQKDVAHRLERYGIEVSAKTIHNWEKGVAHPNARQFLALCDILGVEDVMWSFAGIHKGPYAGLNQPGRDKAREFIALLSRIEEYRDDTNAGLGQQRHLRLYDISVSAGTGNYLGESSYEIIEAPGYVPDAVDFALRVSGDSMEPLFRDGQMIWVKEQETLGSGEIGVFAYSGEAYCKKLVIEGGAALLRSLNTKYEDVSIKEDFGFKVIGKVIS